MDFLVLAALIGIVAGLLSKDEPAAADVTADPPDSPVTVAAPSVAAPHEPAAQPRRLRVVRVRSHKRRRRVPDPGDGTASESVTPDPAQPGETVP